MSFRTTHSLRILLRTGSIALLLRFIMVLGVANADESFNSDKAPSKLTVATWNLEWFFDDDLSDNKSKVAKEQSSPSHEEWEWKLYVTAAAIAKFKPTILAVQEIENKQVLLALTKVLKDRHDINYRVAFIDGNDSGTEQDVGVLYQSGLVEFSRREQNNAMFRSNRFYNLSKHLICRFQWNHKGNNVELDLMTLHLRATAEASDLRKRQCRLAHYWMEKSINDARNVIVLGDMNFEEHSGTVAESGDGSFELLGKETDSTRDDLFDLLTTLPVEKRRTHLVLDKQFDRIVSSQNMVSSTSNSGLVFEKIEVLDMVNIRGREPDHDHFESRFTKDREERDISDHHPVVATFRFE